MAQIRLGLLKLQDLRIGLVRLIHESVPEDATLLEGKFQRINREMINFQSVLKAVTEEHNCYYETE